MWVAEDGSSNGVEAYGQSADPRGMGCSVWDPPGSRRGRYRVAIPEALGCVHATPISPQAWNRATHRPGTFLLNAEVLW